MGECPEDCRDYRRPKNSLQADTACTSRGVKRRQTRCEAPSIGVAAALRRNLGAVFPSTPVMGSRLSTRWATAIAVAAVGCLPGCFAEVCPGAEPPAPFDDFKAEMPQELVFCEPPGQRRDFPRPGKPRGEGDLPNQSHVGFKSESPKAAWLMLVDHLESRGWTRVAQDDNSLGVTFDKGPNTIDVKLINNNAAKFFLNKDRVHGYLRVTRDPCRGPNGSLEMCSDDTRLQCSNGWPTQVENCKDNDQTCLKTDEFGVAACVSDLCRVQLMSRGVNPSASLDACPERFAEAAAKKLGGS